MSNPHPLDAIFHPRSIAVAGASASEQETGWVARLLNFGYSGRLYPVNPRADEISGLKVYPSVRDIPGPVDHVIFNVPARLAPQIMEDSAAKGVKVAHVYTAGFGETGKEEGKRLEEQVAATARRAGIRVIGPNCMGLYCPAGGLTFEPYFSTRKGPVSFISQTGAGSSRFVSLANERGIYFSKVVSYGNAMDLDAPDFLDYLADDPETEIIASYIEGVKDGRRYLAAVSKCLTKKPLIILKAGLTESGAGAVASHTASLAGSKNAWEAFFRQTGAISADSLEEITDIILFTLRMPIPRGRRVGIVGRGGGLGVMATDICENAGLKVPPFLPETREKLEAVIRGAGAGLRNPVESDKGMRGAAEFYEKGLVILDADPQIDSIIVHNAVDVYGDRRSGLAQQLVQGAEILGRVAKKMTKPIAATFYGGDNIEVASAVLEAKRKLLAEGVPVFNSIEAAAKAISKLVRYREFTRRNNLSA